MFDAISGIGLGVYYLLFTWLSRVTRFELGGFINLGKTNKQIKLGRLPLCLHMRNAHQDGGPTQWYQGLSNYALTQ